MKIIPTLSLGHASRFKWPMIVVLPGFQAYFGHEYPAYGRYTELAPTRFISSSLD